MLLPDGPPGAGSWRRVPVAQVVAFAPEGDPSDSAAVRITHLTPLVADEKLSVSDFALATIDRLRADVAARLAKLA